MCESDYLKVSLVRKLLERRVRLLREGLEDRFKVLSQRLDGFEEEFAKETSKDETELEKLAEYKLNTIELFEGGGDLLARIEDRIELMKGRIEQRKVKLDFDAVSVNEQIACLGQMSKKEEAHLYEDVDDFVIYETFYEGKERAAVRLTSSPCELSKPIKVLPCGSNRPPVPVRPNRPSQHCHGTDLAAMRRSNSFSSLSGLKIETQDSPFKVGPISKKSASLDARIDKVGVSVPAEVRISAKGRMGTGPGQILRPKCIAISPKTGCIFVAEKGNNRVQVFASTGDTMYSFSRKTLVPSDCMIKPYGICVLGERVFVSVTQYSCVHAYSVSGDFINKTGGRGTCEGRLDFPTGMGTDGTNRVYVCDYGNNRVQAFSKELQFKQIIGAGHLTNPTDIAVDQIQDLYVLDRATTIVHLFNSKGVYQKKIIKIIKYPILSNPQFIAISPKGHIVLSDLLSNSVNVFTLDGGLRQTLGGPRDKEMFGEPRGVVFDKNGNLVVVCHKENGCLQIIEIDM